MSRPRRIGVVGLGAAAKSIHLPAWKGLPDLEVVGGVDPAADPGAFPFPLFRELDQLLERGRPDLVAVLTPPDAHFDATRRALEAGCHVLCEKPFMPSLEEARQVVDLARAASRRVVVNQQYRFMRIHQAAQAAVGSDDMGELLFLAARQTFVTDDTTEAGWRGRSLQRTCREFGVHVLDLCRFLFAAEPVSIRARMPRPGGEGTPELLDLIELEFPGERVAHLTLDRLSRGPHRYLELRLDGERASVETAIGGRIALSVGVRGGRRRGPFAELEAALGGRALLYRDDTHRTLATDPLDLFAAASRRLLAAVLDAIAAGETPPCDATDNLRSLALVEAAYRSRGRTLRLDADGFPLEPVA